MGKCALTGAAAWFAGAAVGLALAGGRVSVASAATLTLDSSEVAFGAAREPGAGAGVAGAVGRRAFGVRPVGGDADGPVRAPDWITFSYGLAADGDDGTHHQAAVMPSWFVADTLEFGVELSGWYVDQEEGVAGGGVRDASTWAASFRFLGRWHLLGTTFDGRTRGEGAEDLDWTVFVEAGIGMIFSGDEVPVGGTRANFIPTGGVGGTVRVSDGGARLVLGVRWHHVSNARTSGDRKNPDFNAPQVYAGLVLAF
jgi:hypothetical protein